jgi:hypothetical protein
MPNTALFMQFSLIASRALEVGAGTLRIPVESGQRKVNIQDP